MIPDVSVVVTTYNQGPYVAEALRSVFAQTWPPREVVVVDDGSEDDTPAQVAAFGRDVVYVRQATRGVAGARNAGVQRARGTLVAFLDGDDVWEPEHLAAQVEAASTTTPPTGLVAVDGVEVAGERVLRPSLFAAHAERCFADPGATVAHGDVYRLLLHDNLIATTSQVMVPAAVLAAVGPSDERIRVVSDYDLYLRIAARYPVTLVRRRLTRWRYLPTSASGPAPRRALVWRLEMARVLRKHLAEAPAAARPLVQRSLRRRVLATAKDAAYYGALVDRVEAWRCLWRLVAEHGVSPALLVWVLALGCPRRLAARLGPGARQALARVLVPA